MIERVTRALRARARTHAAPAAPDEAQPDPQQPGPPVVGMVEEFTRRLVTGWVSVPEEAPPTRITLHVGGLELSATTATPRDTMSGWNSALRGGAPDGDAGPADAAPPAGLVHSWQVPMIPGPPDDRRNSRQQIRTFSFRVRGLWPYVRKGTRIVVKADGWPLPIHRHGMYLTPPRNGKHRVRDLRRLLEEGHVLSQFGRIQLSKKHDLVWQDNVMRLYRRCADIVRETFGYDLFVVYGTLLGAVREGGYIGHDVDFDTAYVSASRTGPDAARELQDLALALIERGLDVECMACTLHVSDPDRPGDRIDIFHTFFDAEGLMRFPFGVAGVTPFREQDWRGVEEIPFPGGTALAPVAAEELVEHLYGPDWRRPKPGFNWNLDRTDAALDGVLTTAMRTKVYWANFYSRRSVGQGSTFFEFVDARPDTPATVIDIGCGDGRDACAFGSAGRRVVGLDQSPVGIAHATAHAAQLDLTERVQFRVCDVSDSDDLGKALEAPRSDGAGAEQPVLFYLRFFLHAIPEDTQAGLLRAIEEHSRPGDLFAAEFRTDKDEARTHVHTRHYRRFQSAADFSASLTGHGFEILHDEESTGLSPYGDEDPVLYRVVARCHR